MTDNDDNVDGLGFAVVVFFVTLPLAIVLNAYALAYLWLWFLVPLGIPAIGLMHAIGISLIKGLVLLPLAREKYDEGLTKAAKIWRSIGRVIFTPLIYLGLGSLVHSLM